MTNLEKPWYTSVVKSFLSLDAPQALGVSPEAYSRDYSTLESRVYHEGESFLTKTLPLFGKHFDACLQREQFTAIEGFKNVSRSRRIPAFLRGMTKLVFADDGSMVESPSLIAIRLIRQICYWWKKLVKEYDDAILSRFIKKFKTVDDSLPDCLPDNHGGLVIAKAFVTELFRGFTPKFSEMRPKHGPGAVADGENVSQKRKDFRKFKQLLRVFPLTFWDSYSRIAMDPSSYLNRPSCEYGLSRTEFVPKDSSGPRIIGLEPREYMWIQQALKSILYSYIESHRFTRGHINFTDQTINRQLTINWREFDTLDMSEASDRNSLALVKYLFGDTEILRLLLAARTPGTRLPNGEILWFKKFAPMGSACCFPVEAIVFYALAIAGLHTHGMPLELARRSVYVYGDDIIVPHGSFETLKPLFEAVGLKFNESKCCVSGKFRESCGLDSYDGVDVTPIKAKNVTLNRADPSTLKSFVEHANMLYDKGYWASANTMRKIFNQVIGWRLPQSCSPIPVLSWRSCRDTYRIRVKNSIPYVSGWVLKPKTVKATAEVEINACHESFAREGPVGRLSTKGLRERVFDKRYSVVWRKGFIPFVPDISKVSETPLQQLINKIAVTQQIVEDRHNGLINLSN